MSKMDLCISNNVIDKIKNLYKLPKEEILKIISRPPQSAVLRINTQTTDISTAVDKLKNHYKEDKYDVIKHPLLDDIIVIIPKHHERHPVKHEKEIMVDGSCGTAILRGADIYAPGVLAAPSSLQVGDLVSVYCDVMKECRKGFPKTFTGKKFYLGNGVAKMSRTQLFEPKNIILSGVAVEMNDVKYHLPSFNELDTNVFFAQNLPSIVVGHILDVQQDDTVLDMCAAPGGKSSHIATLLRGKGSLISIDKTPNKVEKIKENLMKLNLKNVKCYCYDSTKLLDDSKETSEDLGQPPFPPNSFDRILLDPPCSGLGQRPQLRYILSDKELASYPLLQRKFFKQAIRLLKPSGTLVFSTCTILPEENEAQVAWVLETFPEMYLVDQSPRLGRIGMDGFGLDSGGREKVQRFDEFFTPSSSGDTIGFFIAKFMKRSL